ncbi:MAG: zinc ABC transporter substrate-binding protein [Defluviimonas denitrificans]
MPRLLLPAAILLSATAAMAEVPQVVTDVPITQSLVAGVMGDLGTPEVIVTKGADPHDYQLRPSQARALAGANIVFWVGPEMTPWLNGPLEASGAATRVELLEVAGTHLRHFDEAAEDHDDHDHADHDHETDHVHDHSGTDPMPGSTPTTRAPGLPPSPRFWQGPTPTTPRPTAPMPKRPQRTSLTLIPR